MSADRFAVFFGLRFDIDIDDEDEMEEISDGSDVRIVSAQKAGLDFFTGGKDENDYHLFIGKVIGSYGWEGSSHREMDIEELREIYVDISNKISDAGFHEIPKFHFQFFGDQ